MPTKRLPVRPNLDHLKHQARDLLRDRREGTLAACQRVREFHPRLHRQPDEAIRRAAFTLGDAYLTIAREYGFRSWARLSECVRSGETADLDRPHHERIRDAAFRRAVDLLDDGDVEGLRAYLAERPDVVRARVTFEGGNYFQNPSLLEFVAENPIRHDSLPPTIVEVARVIMDAGARSDQDSLEMTLALVCSGGVSRECGVQAELVELLCDYGADPQKAMGAALGHGEFDAVRALVGRGGAIDLAGAAATGRIDDVRRLLPDADASARHRALAWATQFGHADIVGVLLDAGEDPDRYNPEGTHAHSTPLHQAAFAGHLHVVRLLVSRGARRDLRDIHYQGTPREWAEHGGRHDVAAYLRALEGASE